MSILSILRRDLSAQIAVSRNRKESWWTGLRRCYWSIVYLYHGVVSGLRATKYEQLGETVLYKDKRVQICNWAGSAYPTLAGDGFYQQNVPRAEITSIPGQKWHRFNVIFGWYMGSWHGIYVNERLERNQQRARWMKERAAE